MELDWKQLQNGSDIRGVAMDGIIGERVTLTDEKVGALGRGFARYLAQKGLKNGERVIIAIGIDSRITGSRFMRVAQKSITDIDYDVVNCGLASTPSMVLSTLLPETKAVGAIMFTGSHLPYNRNGMKFIIQGRDITAEQLSEIIELAKQEKLSKIAPHQGEVRIVNILAIYSEYLRKMIIDSLQSLGKGDQPLEGLKIVVDAGNGAGGFYATHVLRPLGADISDSQLLTPDGRFPNHVPNPDDYEAMEFLRSSVAYAKADLGILFDADVDRMAIVDGDNHLINRNELVALTSAIVLEDHPGTKIVTDSVTSNGLSKFLTELGGEHIRYQRGYRNVIAEARRVNEKSESCWLAIETSGHAAFKENDFRDDGAYFATKLLIKLAQLKAEGKKLYSLIDNFAVACESCELRLQITEDDFSSEATDVLASLRQYVTHIPNWEIVLRNYEGLRVICNDADGWFMCRLSLHDPVLSLNIESDKTGGIKEILHSLKLFFRNVHSVDSLKLYEVK